MEGNQNLRILYLARILYERTDEDAPLGTGELIDLLREKYGISTHRATLYEDIRLLGRFGLDINTVRSSQNRYYLASRLFDLPELKLLIDAVESSRFITRKKSGELVEKLGRLSSAVHGEELKRDLYPEGRIKPGNERIYYIVDTIHAAIRQGKRIAFRYFRYNVQKRQILRNNGAEYVFSPWMLVWNGDYYYMLGYSHKHGSISSFRVDRIAGQPRTLETAAEPMPEGFDPADHVNTMFRMFTGERLIVELSCDNDTMDSIIDRFGADADTCPLDDERFRLRAEVAVNHVFFNWIFGFSGKVKIVAPESVREEYAQRLRRAIEEI